jgi:hypothetical protein
MDRDRLALLCSRRRPLAGDLVAPLYHAIGEIEAALSRR